MVGSGNAEDERPSSEGLYVHSLLGLAGAVLFLCLATYADWPLFSRAIGAIIIYSVPQIACALSRQKAAIREHVNLEIDRSVLKRLIALCLALGTIWLAYHLIELLGTERYKPARVLMDMVLPSLILVAIPYLCLVNRIEPGLRDDCYHVGNLLLDRLDPIDWGAIGEFFRGWFIKAFFFPLMLWELLISTAYFERSLFADGNDVTYIYGIIVALVYFMDVCIASAGYLATFRLFGWQIRSSNPYPGAWIFTLICYYPFFGPIYRALLDYKDDYYWSDWLADNPILLAIWAMAIILLKICWIWSIAPFGLRFSNLTNRGIITDGAFSLTKHPSYVSKNLFWWLIHIPFISTIGFVDGLTSCVQLLAINAIYFIRAKYEERHLSEEPRYTAYALWIEKHGIFRSLGHWLPVLRYQERPMSATT
jgi:protein-S-isoprenylcysteine O-methyltransferase Ste14